MLCYVHPQGGEKNVGVKFTGESCKCTPRQRVHPSRQSKSPIIEENRGNLGSGRDYLGSFSVCRVF